MAVDRRRHAASSPPTLADVAERGGRLAADRLQRRQQPRPAAPRHPRPGAGGDRRARLLAQPRRPQPAHPRLHLIGLRFNPAQEGTANAAMDRFVHILVETSGEAGYHVLLFSGDAGRPGRRLRRPAALHRRRRLRRHRHLPRQPAGGLADQRAARRSWRSAGRGTTPTRPTRGSTSTAPPAPSWPPTTCSTRATPGSPGSAGARTPSSARTGASGWTRAMHARDLPTTGLASRVEDTIASGARGRARCCSTRPRPTAFVCASDTLAMGVLHTLGDRGHPLGQGHRGRRLRRLPGRPGGAGRADLGAPAARAGGRRAGQGPRGPALDTARRPGPACCSTPTLAVRAQLGAELSSPSTRG